MGSETSSLRLTEYLLNHDLKHYVMDYAGEYIDAYQLSFSQGNIDLSVKLSIKTIGEINAVYRLTVTDFRFSPSSHAIRFDYLEDVRSGGNIGQNLLLKAFKLQKGTVLRSILALKQLPGITADETSCSVDLEQLVDLSKDPWSRIELRYGDSRNGILELFFSIR